MTPAQKQYLMKLKTAKARILKVNNSIRATSGIYLFYRENENGQMVGYVGQSSSILRRCAEHILSYQKIDLSIKKHGLYSKTNPTGYKIIVLKYCDAKYLNELEKKYIRVYLEKGWQLKNITSGGQDAGRTNIAEARPARKYRDGLEQGFNNAKKEVADFMKYLKVRPNQFKKNGQPTELAMRKMKEFKEWLEK